MICLNDFPEDAINWMLVKRARVNDLLLKNAKECN